MSLALATRGILCPRNSISIASRGMLCTKGFRAVALELMATIVNAGPVAQIANVVIAVAIVERANAISEIAAAGPGGTIDNANPFGNADGGSDVS